MFGGMSQVASQQGGGGGWLGRIGGSIWDFLSGGNGVGGALTNIGKGALGIYGGKQFFDMYNDQNKEAKQMRKKSEGALTEALGVARGMDEHFKNYYNQMVAPAQNQYMQAAANYYDPTNPFNQGALNWTGQAPAYGGVQPPMGGMPGMGGPAIHPGYMPTGAGLTGQVIPTGHMTEGLPRPDGTDIQDAPKGPGGELVRPGPGGSRRQEMRYIRERNLGEGVS